MKKYFFVGIIIVALFLRLDQLSQIPPSPSLDEVSIGYNAFSILKTGKDEYGNAFPVLLRAYDDFRPALYVYLVVPFVWIFGLTSIAVRLPSVLMGVLVVYLTYRIGRMIGFKYFGDDGIGRYASLFVAISPWHIYISRLGHEANLGLTLLVVGIYFFLRAVIEGDKRAFIISGSLFGLSLHGYQSQKIITPILMCFGVLLFWKELWKATWYVAVALVLAIIIALPAVMATFSPQGLSRLQGTSAIAGKAKIEAIETVAQNYISHFFPKWLFTGADREAHKTPGIGLLYLWEAPLLILGLWVFWRFNMSQKLKVFFVVWLLTSPLPAAITTQAPHAMRAYTFIPVLQLISAMGFWYLLREVNRNKRILPGLIFGFVVAITFGKFWFSYTMRFPVEQSDSFQYATKNAIAYAQKNKSLYDRVELSHQGALYQSYMFYLYYSKFDPKKYLSLGGTKSGGYEAAHYIDTFAFGYLPQSINDFKKKTLYFYDIDYTPAGARVIERFTHLDGTSAIVAVTL